MKLKQLLIAAEDAIQDEKQNQAVAAIKKSLIEIDELEKALVVAKSNHEILLNTDLGDFDVDLW